MTFDPPYIHESLSVRLGTRTWRQRDDMPNYLEPEKPREEALEAAVSDLGGASSVEAVTAALEAIRRVPIDVDQMLNAIRVPDDAASRRLHSEGCSSGFPTGGAGGSPAARLGSGSWWASRNA